MDTPTNPLVEPLKSGTTFDPNRLNIALDPTPSNHTDPSTFSGDLMVPSINWGCGDGYLYPAASFIARGFNDEIIMKYVDVGNTGAENGTADNPWDSLSDAVDHEAAGAPFLMIPGVYGESPLTVTEAHEISVAMGGTAILE